MSDDKKSGYFNMSEALDDFNYQSFGAKEKAVSGLKIFGKGLFNVARFAVTEAVPAFTEAAASQVLKNDKATDEQRQRAEEAKTRAAAMRERYKQGNNE